MHCTRCGKDVGRVSLRCPECRRRSPYFWFNLSALMFLVTTIAANYFYIEFLLPVEMSYFAGLGTDLPLPVRVHYAFTMWVVQFLPFIVIALIAAWLVVRYKRIRLPGFLVSGSLLTALTWGLLALTFTGSLTAFTESMISLPNPLIEQRMYSRLSAVHALIQIDVAEAKYRQANPKLGYACSLGDLRQASTAQNPSPGNAGTISEGLAQGNALNYKVQVKDCANSPAPKYMISAIPTDLEYGNKRIYCTNETGAIRFSDQGKEEECFQSLKGSQ